MKDQKLSPLPSYRSHKVVQAAKIREVRLLQGLDGALDYHGIFLLGFDAPRVAAGSWLDRCTPWSVRAGPNDDWGYLVIYEDGYESWSPTEAFEGGYVSIPPFTPTTSAGDVTGEPCEPREHEGDERTWKSLYLTCVEDFAAVADALGHQGEAEPAAVIETARTLDAIKGDRDNILGALERLVPTDVREKDGTINGMEAWIRERMHA